MEAVTKLYHEHPRTVLFSAAATLRLALPLAFPALPDLLSARVEISTPVNSFKRLHEGIFLFEHGLDPYDGGIFHQAPLLLPLFSLLPASTSVLGRLASILLFTILDVLSADCLHAIAASGTATVSSVFSSPRKTQAWQPLTVAAVYLLNPFTILTCLGRPTTVFTTFFTLLSIRHATEGKLQTSAFALAIASYLSLHPALLLPPIGLLCYDQLCKSREPVNDTDGLKSPMKHASSQTDRPKVLDFGIRFFSCFLLTAALLLALSRVLLPSFAFLPSVYLTPLRVPDLTPNPGLWWYFFIEMFDPFRSFFLGVFWLHMLSYSVPFCLRMRKQPLAAVVSMLGITAIFQPYANVGEAGAWLSCLTLLSHTFEVSSTHRYTFPAVAVLLYTSLLGPAFHHLWLYAGSGNANFFYAITLVWNLALLIILTDTVYSVLRDEWEAERPEGKGKEVRQI
ncbi:hypothetical protein B0A48_02030 [Cryoendolithus antarcticus]|uniref:GPI transamidase component GAB1 n=1 Tax=Cryoendolithus antarcticus TaxID=1507870 RepID=A0A1V8TMU9_9PEZI|nr:hypothetical protein B0A48_02030 [Cryoendolithus antarcticus]